MFSTTFFINAAAELELALKADAQRIKQDRRVAKALFLQIQAKGYAGSYSRVTVHGSRLYSVYN